MNAEKLRVDARRRRSVLLGPADPGEVAAERIENAQSVA